jgi:hypothetical protein
MIRQFSASSQEGRQADEAVNLFLPFSVAAIGVTLQAFGLVCDESIDGPYRLAADSDIRKGVGVCLDFDDSGRNSDQGANCEFLVAPPVFAVGWNRSYIVAARYPDNDRSRTEYYTSCERLFDQIPAAKTVEDFEQLLPFRRSN